MNKTSTLEMQVPAPEAALPSPVLVLAPVATKAYSYAVPPGLEVRLGDVVRVPLGPRQTVGVVWGAAEPVEGRALKAIAEMVETPPLTEELVRFCAWVSRYTLTPPGMMLRMVLRVPDAIGAPKTRLGIVQTGDPPKRMTEARSEVLRALEDGEAMTKAELAKAAKVSSTVVEGLIKARTLSLVELPPEPIAGAPDPRFARTDLTPMQASAAHRLRERVRDGRFVATLLDGVTGSGKTEVYFEAIAEALALHEDAQVLVLMPEIALTAAFLGRFAKRFGNPPLAWHSSLTMRRRERVWRAVESGEARVVIGARSSLFLPFQHLALVIVDEEHDPAFKQEERATYHARDMAIVRARMNDAPVILASATPSLETYVNAETDRYRTIRLPARFGDHPLPEVQPIDMRIDGPEPGHWLSPRLVEAVHETVARGEQALLFLNRRGYAPLTLCRKCGHRFGCSQCTAWLVEHRFRRKLLCHHCGHEEPRPNRCPACDAPDSLAAVGPGVERVAEEVAETFPKARAVTLSSDILGGVDRLRAELETVAKGGVDIVIGTQLVAKGHNFPLMTLAGVVDADVGLAHGDPRGAERTFQLLSQVVGRAGRARDGSLGLLQTYAPDLPVMQALVSGDRDRFYAEERAERLRTGLPPFGRLAALVVSGEPHAHPDAYARTLAQAAPPAEAIEVLGPAEAPIAMIRGRRRFRLLLKATRSADVQGYIGQWLEAAPPPRNGVRVAIDVDPQTFM